MTVPTVALDETSPAGTGFIRDGDDRIREYKTQNREVMAVDHDYPSSGVSASAGRHKQVTLEEAADIGTGAAGVPILGAQTLTGKPELTYTDEDNTDVIITKAGHLNSDEVQGISTQVKAAIVNWLYPVGSLFISTLSTNPGTLLGTGTWTAFGAGRVLVGLNGADADFDTAEETGGAKTAVSGAPSDTAAVDEDTPTANVGGGTHTHTTSIVQPYIVVYMWKRTV